MIYFRGELDEPIRLQRKDYFFNYYENYSFVSFEKDISSIGSWATIGTTSLIEWDKDNEM